MDLVPSHEVVKQACAEGYALPAFNHLAELGGNKRLYPAGKKAKILV